MHEFHSNPVSEYFVPTSFSPSTDIYGSVEYDYEDKCVYVTAWDDAAHAQALQAAVKSAPEAEALLAELAAKWGRDNFNPDEFLPLWEDFFRAVENAVTVSTPLTDDEGHFCDTCGDYNTNTMDFLLVPAVPGTPLTEDILCVHWEFGCYGGLTAEGKRSAVEEEARDILTKAVSVARKGAYKKALKEALNTLG